MHRIALSLVLHNHQPVGNFDHVFDEASRSAYTPMVAALERHPKIRVALHYSGPLLDWLRRRQPELIARIRALVSRGQAEILGGGYYEPILPIIPDADKRGQIEKMARAIAEDFGAQPEGFWLAERVWEPHIARPLGEAGVRYTIVDDAHFDAVGLEESELLGYYMTEEAGIPLALFPSLRRLRYIIPWSPVEEVIACFQALAETDVRPEGRADPLDLVLMGDDGEKFGLWPTSGVLCWEQGWVERFFDALESTRWIETVTPGEYLRTREPAGRIYLPAGTYDEMAEWALPPARVLYLARLRQDLRTRGQPELERFVRGGFWRHFLIKYPEINTLYRLALRAGIKVHAMPPGPEQARGLDELWAGQCNCTYWHGVFGGVYLPHIRGAAFGHLIEAEALADRSRHPGPYEEGEAADLDGDGRLEVRLATDQVVLTVDPARGGSLVEWDDRPSRRNLGNVLTRRRESYHAELVRAAEAQVAGHGRAESIHAAVRIKEPGMERLLVYDRIRRATLRVHLLPPGTTFEQAQRDEQEDLGEFAAGGYAWGVEHGVGVVRVRLTRRAAVRDGAAMIDRTIEAAGGHRGVAHETRLTWAGQAPVELLLVEEWNLGIFGARNSVWLEAGGSRVPLHDPGDLPSAARVEIVEEHSGLRLVLTPSVPAPMWTYPLFTISNSEGGFERICQGVAVLFRWQVRLAPGENWAQTTRGDVAQ